MNKMGNKREFYVVQFISSGYYVCVPKSWLILPSKMANCVPNEYMLVTVAYPEDEDQIVTKYLVKRKESYNKKWNKHTAVIRYGSDSYDDAESWIDAETTRNYYEPKSIVTVENRIPELSHQRMVKSNQRPQKPKIGIHKSIKPKDKKQKPDLQGVTKKTVPSYQSNNQNLIQKLLLNNPQLQITMTRRSTVDNTVEIKCYRQNTEMPSRSVYQSSRTQHTNTTAHENEDQNLCTQAHLVDQSTRTNSKTKRVHFTDDPARSPVTGKNKNTKRTLKYRTTLSGLILVELIPNSGIYMTYERVKLTLAHWLDTGLFDNVKNKV